MTTPYTLACAADDAWQAELERVFGGNASLARYQPRGCGEPGTKLRRLYEARTAAMAAWRAPIDACVGA